MLKKFSTVFLAMLVLLSINISVYAANVSEVASETNEVMSLEPLATFTENLTFIEKCYDDTYGEYKVYKADSPVIRKAYSVDMEGLMLVGEGYDDTHGKYQIYKSDKLEVQTLGPDQIILTARLYCKFSGHISPPVTEYFGSIWYAEIDGSAGGYLNAESYFHGFDVDDDSGFTFVEYHGTMFKYSSPHES